MTLSSLRPRHPTDLVQLSGLVRANNAKTAALPSSLPEELLISVARDLRSMDAEGDSDTTRSNYAGPLMLVFYLLFGATKSPKEGQGMVVSEQALYDSLHVYQWAVEREIVTRITGVGGETDTDTLLQRLGDLCDS